jgi:hypothetical protein
METWFLRGGAGAIGVGLLDEACEECVEGGHVNLRILGAKVKHWLEIGEEGGGCADVAGESCFVDRCEWGSEIRIWREYMERGLRCGIVD